MCQALKTFLQVLSCIRCGIYTRCLPIIWWKYTNTFHLNINETDSSNKMKKRNFKKVIQIKSGLLESESRNLMKHRVMSWIYGIPAVHISCYKKMSVSSSQKLCLMSTGMTPQNSLSVNIVCIIITPAYMISRNQDIIKILQEVHLQLQKWTKQKRKCKKFKIITINMHL